MSPYDDEGANVPAWPTGERAVDVWAAAPLVTGDETVSRWLRLNDISPAMVAARDLARALPSGDLAHLGLVASDFDPVSDRLLVQLVGVDGSLATLHAEHIIPGHRQVGVGTTPPPASRRGRVLANRAARMLLAVSPPPNVVWKPRVLVVESVPKFLVAASVARDLDAPSAVIGLLSGCWSPEIAERIPSGSHVTIVPTDEPPSAFARIQNDLAERCHVEIGNPEKYGSY